MEMDHFQKILSLNNFIFLFSLPALVLVFWYMQKQNFTSLLKEKIALGLFLALFLPTLSVSLASFINRTILSRTGEQVEITSLMPEFNSMYGVTRDDLMNKIPSHYRLHFKYNSKKYNRAFKKNPCIDEISNSTPCFIVLNNGGLGFDVINLDNK